MARFPRPEDVPPRERAEGTRCLDAKIGIHLAVSCVGASLVCPPGSKPSRPTTVSFFVERSEMQYAEKQKKRKMGRATNAGAVVVESFHADRIRYLMAGRMESGGAHRMFCFWNSRRSDSLPNSSCSGIISMMPVMLAKRSPWFW